MFTSKSSNTNDFFVSGFLLFSIKRVEYNSRNGGLTLSYELRPLSSRKGGLKN